MGNVEMVFQEAVFSAGCFWHVEEFFSKIKGVVTTEVGYSGGFAKKPSYNEVCSGRTGHAESIRIVYDPTIISFAELLDNFWSCHDPTTLNKQGPDIGSQYRSIVFWKTEEEKNIAEQSKEHLNEKLKSEGQSVKTEIIKFSHFFPAEAYHQRYWEKNPNKPKEPKKV